MSIAAGTVGTSSERYGSLAPRKLVELERQDGRLLVNAVAKAVANQNDALKNMSQINCLLVSQTGFYIRFLRNPGPYRVGLLRCVLQSRLQKRIKVLTKGKNPKSGDKIVLDPNPKVNSGLWLVRNTTTGAFA